jgi:Ran GTPase-activating protein 1
MTAAKEAFLQAASFTDPSHTLIPSDVFSIHGQGKKLDTAADVSALVERMKKMEKIKVFIISGNTMSAEAAQCFADALLDRKELEHVDLSDGFTGRLKDQVPKAMGIFGEALKDKPNLVYLNVSDNALGPPGAQALVSFLSSAVSLKTLCMTNNGLGMLGAKFVSEALGALGQAGGGLSIITLGRNRLENEGATLIAKSLVFHSSHLKEFSIPQNGIRSAGIIALSKSLGQCKNLVSLDLQDNTFTLEGAEAFSCALPAWKNLRSLNLNDAYLTGRGASLIFKVLRDIIQDEASSKQSSINESLEYLQLQYNGIRDSELLLLISLLPSFSNIKSLHLNGNSFDPESSLTEQLRETLIRHEKEDILDSLSDMELDEDDSESESESEDQDQKSLSDSDASEDSHNTDKGFDKRQEEAKARFEELVNMMEATEIKTDTTSTRDSNPTLSNSE